MPTYDAFISYSHAKDKPVAAALQSVIQKLGKPWYKRRGLRVFRDDTSLSATPHLWPSIESALAQSRYLILLASPEAASSPWIAKEVEYWLAHKSPDTLFIGLTDGDLAWSPQAGDFDWRAKSPLPEALKGRFANEPKWVDLRACRDNPSARKAHMIELGADFAAAIHHMPKEDLLSQELQQQRRALTLALSAAAGLFVLAALATWQWQRAGQALAAATKGTNTLVSEVAIKFRNIAGVPIDTVRAILDRTLELQSDLARIGGDRADVKRSEALARRELANTLVLQGSFEDALRYAHTSQAIMERLVNADPGNTELRRDLSLSLNRVGEALAKLGRHDEALAPFRKALAIRQELTGPDDLRAQRDLAVSHERVADTLSALEEDDAAVDEYQEALAIRERLTAAKSENAQWQLDLAVSYDKKGNLLFKRKPDAALDEYRKALAIRERLVRLDPVSVHYARDLSSSYVRMGDALARAGRNDAAIESFQTALEMRRRLAQDQGNVNAQLDLVVSLVRLADAGDDSLARITEALDIVQALNAQGKLPADGKIWAKDLEDRLQSLLP